MDLKHKKYLNASDETYQMHIEILNYCSIILQKHWLKMGFRSMQQFSNKRYSISASTSFLQQHINVNYFITVEMKFTTDNFTLFETFYPSVEIDVFDQNTFSSL